MILKQSILKLDSLQADLTIYPDVCPEPWRAWMVQAHAAMCQVVAAYRDYEANDKSPLKTGLAYKESDITKIHPLDVTWEPKS